MSNYGQYCPISKAAEVFAERWTPLVLRELLMGSHRFSDLRRGVPLMSPTLLSTRLKTLEAAGIVKSKPVRDGHGREYHLTEAGEEFRPIVLALGAWGHRWVRSELRSDERDPLLLMWDIRRRLDLTRFPAGRTVIRFQFVDGIKDKRTWWLVVEGDDVDLCLTDPGYETQIVVTTRLQTLLEVWMGDRRLVDAVADGSVGLEGPPRLQRSLPSWLLLSAIASVASHDHVVARPRPLRERNRRLVRS